MANLFFFTLDFHKYSGDVTMSGGELWSKFSFDTMESGGGRMHEGGWALNDNLAKLGGGRILEGGGRFDTRVR